MKYRTTYDVEGFGEFPYDMLRYDCSFPWHEADSALLEPSHQERRRVTLAKRHDDRKPQICADRWRSFGWQVDLASIATVRR